MPTYTYHCDACDSERSALRHIDDRDSGPECCGRTMRRRITATMVTPDITSYRTVAADKETGKRMTINSRREHREFLKRNDFIEVG